MYSDISAAIGFSLLIFINMVNFSTHQPNVAPNLFDYNVDITYCISIVNGSLHCYSIHLHHWLLSFLLLIILILVKHNWFISFLQGAAAACFIDGLLFIDRFLF